LLCPLLHALCLKINIFEKVIFNLPTHFERIRFFYKYFMAAMKLKRPVGKEGVRINGNLSVFGDCDLLWCVGNDFIKNLFEDFNVMQPVAVR